MSHSAIAASFPSRFSHVKLIAKGGMGEIYHAFDTVHQREVALKTLNVDGGGFGELRARFSREARMLLDLDHPNIVKVFEISDGPLPFISLEFIEGETLRKLINAGKFKNRDSMLGYADRLLDALQYSADKGILHRDIKPNNVLVSKEDNVKLIDFGLARGKLDPHLTQTGHRIGTPLYFSPERMEGKPADIRSEIYSFGMMLYEMLTGTIPYPENELQYVLEGNKIPIRERDSGIPEFIADAVMTALAKNPSERHPGFAIFRQKLKSG